MKLKPKQQKFAEAFDGNGAEACRLAGYKGNVQVLSTQAARLLKNAEVLKIIEAREAKRSKTVIATREERQRFWTRMMRRKSNDLGDRLKASELLGKSEADFIEKHQHGVDGELADLLREARTRAQRR